MSEFKVAVVGGSGVGKSAITVQFVHQHFIDEHEAATTEDSFRKLVHVEGDTAVLLDVLDAAAAGKEEEESREKYMQIAQGFLLVYSSSSRKSFEEIPAICGQILRVKSALHVPMVLCANKADLAAVERQVSTEEGQELARSIGCPFFELSAKTRVLVDEAFAELARQIICH